MGGVSRVHPTNTPTFTHWLGEMHEHAIDLSLLIEAKEKASKSVTIKIIIMGVIENHGRFSQPVLSNVEAISRSGPDPF